MLSSGAAAMHQIVVVVLWQARVVMHWFLSQGKSSRGDAFPFVSFCLTLNQPRSSLDVVVWCCIEADYCVDLQAGRSVNTDVDWRFFFPEENSFAATMRE